MGEHLGLVGDLHDPECDVITVVEPPGGECWLNWGVLEKPPVGSSGSGGLRSVWGQTGRRRDGGRGQDRTGGPGAAVERPRGAAGNPGATVTQQDCYQLRCHGNKAAAGPRSTRSGRSFSPGTEVTIFKTLHNKKLRPKLENQLNDAFS